MSIIIAIDIGTTHLCVLAYDCDQNNICSVFSAPNNSDAGLPYPKHEQNPYAITGSVFALVDQLLIQLEQQHIARKTITAFVVTGQMHGILLINKTMQQASTNLITWRDQSSRDLPLIQHLNTNTDNAARCGCALQTGYGGSTLYRLNQAKPDLLNENTALGITDFVTSLLTGHIATEPSMAASWGLYNLHEKQWDADLIKQLGLPESVLPTLIESATPFMPLKPEYIQRWSLSDHVMVCAGIGDNQASVIATAPLESGACVINIGTGAQISFIHDKADFVPGLETRPLVQNLFIRTGASLCGGWSYAYLADFFAKVLQELGGLELARNQLMEKMNALGIATKDDADNLLADTHFLGSRLQPDRLGNFSEINSKNFTPGNLIRATVNGIIDELWELGQLHGTSLPSSLYLSGNAVMQNPMIRPAIEKRWGIKTQSYQFREEAALGAARMAAINLRLS